MKPHMMIALLALAVTAHAGEARFGHADWKASPTDPVGFAGQGNNWYPGATPPLTWSHSVDGKSRNILWKVPHPGWTDAQPLVIGNPSSPKGSAAAGRVVGVYSPHYVVCFDADTGKVLWQDELKLMTLPERGEVGQPTGPVPEAALAAKRQLLFERGLAFMRVSVMANPKSKALDATNSVSRRPLVAHAVETMTAWRAGLAADFPESVNALDQSLATLNQYLAGDWESVNKAKENACVAQMFWQQVSKFLKVKMYNCWPGSLSDVMACPVSDGEIVAVTLGFGQVAAYEVATGKRLWAWRDPELYPGSASHCVSPCLWKDLVLVPAAGDPKKGLQSILGVDKRTGVVRWETLDKSSGNYSRWGLSHGCHMSPHLMRLPGGKTILVSTMGHVIDPETGASLGEFPRTATGKHDHGSWGTGFIASFNGTLFKGWEGGGPMNAWPLSLGTDGKVVIEPDYLLGKGNSSNPFALSDRLLAGSKLSDSATGKVLMDREGLGNASSIAGKYLLTTYGDKRGMPVGSPPVAQLATRIYDVSDPAAPKKLGENVLAIPGFTPDISAKHFPKAAELYPTAEMVVGHSNYQGIGFNFSVDTSGLTTIGSRIYLHSPGMLICIGLREGSGPQVGER